MAWDESKVKRDEAGKFSKRPGSKSKGRNISGTAGRSKTSQSLTGIWDTAPHGQRAPKTKPGALPG